MKKIPKLVLREQLEFKGAHLLNPGDMRLLLGGNTYGYGSKYCPKGDVITCTKIIANVVTCLTVEVSCRPINTFVANCSSLKKFNVDCNVGGKFSVKPEK